MMNHNEDHLQDEKPVIEEDARLARILGIVLMLVLTVFGFYVGTVGGKPWELDYQPKDMIAGFKGGAVGLTIALVINAYIYTAYKKTIDRDSVSEWYEPQSGHGHH